MRIFIVEDDRDIAELLILSLQSAGNEVLGWASDGQDAVDLISDLPDAPDLLLLDFDLPGQDGAQVARSLRRQFGALAILVCSAFPHSEEKFSGVDNVFFLQKPFRISDLMASIQAAISNNNHDGPSDSRASNIRKGACA
jgi:DNA-binding response OmpR family regulator